MSFSSPYAAREILSAGKGFHKTDFYGVFPPPENPDIFTEVQESVHGQKKRVAAAPYSMKAMQGLAAFVDNTVELLAMKLDKFAETPDKVLDLGDWLHYFAFDVRTLTTLVNPQYIDTVFSTRSWGKLDFQKNLGS